MDGHRILGAIHLATETDKVNPEIEDKSEYVVFARGLQIASEWEAICDPLKNTKKEEK